MSHRYEMYSVRNTVSNYVISLYGDMVTRLDQTYCGDQFEMYRNNKSLCCVKGTNIVLQVNYTSKTNTLIKKRPDLWLPEVGGQGELGEGSQKVPTSSYKISTRDVMCIVINRINNGVCHM